MGGSSIILNGKFDVAPAPPRGLLDRLLRRGPPVEGHLRIVDRPPGPLAALSTAFLERARQRLPSPWPATDAVFAYLRECPPEVHVRGEWRGGPERAWYVQLHFTGCAGLTEVSSRLAAHWATRWLTEEREAVDAILRTAAFTLDEPLPAEDAGDRFVATERLGYARFVVEPPDPDDPDPARFELDAARLEALDDTERAEVRRALDEAVPEWVATCRCQRCVAASGR